VCVASGEKAAVKTFLGGSKECDLSGSASFQGWPVSADAKIQRIGTHPTRKTRGTEKQLHMLETPVAYGLIVVA
jgi:hypothetical protein